MPEIGAKICGGCDCGAAFRINLIAEWIEDTEGDAQPGRRHCDCIEIASRLRWRVVWIANIGAGPQHGPSLVAASDQFEQHACFGLILVDIDDVVHDRL